jgi:hypothetical protein
MQKRIRSSYEQINKIADLWHCHLSEKYLSNRLEELSLVYEYAELQEKIKEEQAYLREQEREEEKARRDAEREKQDTERAKQIAEQAKQDAERRQREEAERKAAFDQAVQEVRQAMEAAANNQKAFYKKQLEELELQRAESARLLAERGRQLADSDRQLADALERNRRAISLAQQTRSGHVYILSNIGSFGDGVYKIGMSRRKDPEERRRELGDASVPFPFDKHAYIWTEDAPAVERALQQHFDRQRLNLANNRKEFFRITIEEIQAEVEQIKEQLGINAEIRWTMLAEAKEFRLSEAKRKHLEEGNGVD